MIFVGAFQRTIDDKSRVVLPKQIRTEIGEGETIYLTPGIDECVELHTINSLADLANRIKQSQAEVKDLKSFARLFYGRAERCELDSLGRIRIPKVLIDYARLKRDVFLLGVGTNWEIWNLEDWNQYLTEQQNDFDRITKSTFN